MTDHQRIEELRAELVQQILTLTDEQAEEVLKRIRETPELAELNI